MKTQTLLTLLASAALCSSATYAADVFQTGFLKREFYSGKVRADLENGTAGTPTSVTALTSFEAPVDTADNYAQRVSGYFTPATSGDYVFFLCSDDDSDLFLSTDDNPANKKLIAQEAAWSNSRSWNTPGGGASTTEDKRSDLFAASEWPTPNVISLQAGRKYYIEADHHEGGGGDNLAVYIKLATDPDPDNGAAPSAAGGTFGIFVAPATITINTQPQSVTVIEGKNATLSVSATTSSQFGISGYQWKKNGTPIPGATGPTFTLPVQTLADSGAKYSVDISAAGATITTSAEATVTVVPDTTPPQLVSAGSLKNFDGSTEVALIFDEALNGSSVTATSNYTLDNGATVSAARWVTNSSGLDTFQQGVILTVNGVTPGNTYTVSVKGVSDVKGNAITTAQTKTFTASRFSWISIGNTVNNVKNEALAVGTNSFNLVNGGNAFWNTTDDITMVYETVSGDFDKTAQVEWNDPSSNWARAGISARESLNNGQPTTGTDDTNPASRYQMIISDPMTKFDGTAANRQYETNRRRNTGGATDSASAGGQVNYPNSYVRLKRVGQRISMYYSTDGQSWRSLGTTDFGNTDVSDTPLPSDLFVGPTVGVENGNISDEAKKGAYAARIRNYGDLPQKARGSQTYAIGLNFGADEGGAALSPGDVAGVNAVAQGHWNNLTGANSNDTGPVSGIVAEKGAASQNTSVTVEFDSPNTWASQGPRGEQNNPMTGNDQVLMTGYLDTGNATTTHVKISNIPTDLTSAGYDVVVYSLGGVGNRGGAYRVTDENGTVLADYVSVTGPVNPTNFVQVTGTNGTGNFIVFKNLKAANIIVEATTENGLGIGGTPRAPLNAVQLVSPSGLIGTVQNPPALSIARTAGGVAITYEGRLQASDKAEGPYTDVSNAPNPYNTTASGNAKFFRAVR